MAEACDIHIPVAKHTSQSDGKAHTDKEILNSWFDWIVSNTDFDQAIIETSNGKDFWIHVSCKRDRTQNRHKVIREMKKKCPLNALSSSLPAQQAGGLFLSPMPLLSQ